ncbi:ribosomal protein, putative [Ichthyophthirius multifiliis]|uniref:Ribosomal protein, putative n=1 Tax=Ichthyophthirius multifiliis TaxID=5932 RepID=G0QMB9_ICHMU|nr:ribosomal protein, putative [Ichthyophthirius multifiliis]EGR33641.1 ribosomal protein, putative [Ichthyophthirius multifiliis]|eukprot:XP_004037627.1 ribosomal protein, putative [Ichthyophthirius multifiliis]
MALHFLLHIINFRQIKQINIQKLKYQNIYSFFFQKKQKIFKFLYFQKNKHLILYYFFKKKNIKNTFYNIKQIQNQFKIKYLYNYKYKKKIIKTYIFKYIYIYIIYICFNLLIKQQFKQNMNILKRHLCLNYIIKKYFSIASPPIEAQQNIFDFTSKHIISEEQIKNDQKLQQLCEKYEKEWTQKYLETKQKEIEEVKKRLSQKQQQYVEFLAEELLNMDKEIRIKILTNLNIKIQKITNISIVNVNTDWPIFKQYQLDQQQQFLQDNWHKNIGISNFLQGFGQNNQQQQNSSQQEQPKTQKEEQVQKTNFDVELASIDPNQKIKIIKEVRTILGLGLKDAKDIVEKSPVILKQQLKKQEAEEIKEKLSQIGCIINLL